MHLAKTLSWENHEVSIIDSNVELIDRASRTFDVLAIRGSGTSINTLISAGVGNADLLIAVTSIDEVNILACQLARQLGAKTRIARVRNQEYSHPDSPIKLSDLGISQIIHPELEAAREVEKMIKYQDALDIVNCADGKMILAGIRIDQNSKVIGTPLKTLTPAYPSVRMRIVAISRNGKTLIPGGNDSIRVNDIIYVITPKENLELMFEIMGKDIENKSYDVMILGGDLVGRIVAERLEKDKRYNIKLIESDAKLSRLAAEKLESTIVIHANEEMEIDLMVLEGIDEMGVFAALSDDDENNIVTSLFARHMKVKRTITLNSKPEYMPIARAIGLDTAINELLLTSDAILKHLIGTRIVEISSLRGIEAEIVEFIVGSGSKAAGKKISEIVFPFGIIVGAVEAFGEVFVAEGETRILAGNRVVVFCQEDAIPKLEKLFG